MTLHVQAKLLSLDENYPALADADAFLKNYGPIKCFQIATKSSLTRGDEEELLLYKNYFA